MIPDVPLDRVLASVRSTSDRPIPHPRQEPTVTAPRPSPAGLSPLLDQLDEARAKATPGEWATYWQTHIGAGVQHLPGGGVSVENLIGEVADEDDRADYDNRPNNASPSADAALIVAAVNALPELIRWSREREALRRAVLDLADELEGYTRHRGRPAEGSYDYGVNLAQADAAASIRSALTAALTPGADTDLDATPDHGKA